MSLQKLQRLLESGRPIMVVVCGSRDWTDAETIRRRLNRLPRNSLVITGGCRGADQLAAALVPGASCRSEVIPADWKQYGKAAGMIRNKAMIDRKPHLVIAFRLEHAPSPGTRDTIQRARRRNIPVEVITDEATPD